MDRDVYESLDLRLAQHPSETKRYLLCRLLAYCVLYEEGLAFSKGGLSLPEDAPIAQRALDGRLLLHVENRHSVGRAPAPSEQGRAQGGRLHAT